MQHGHCCHTLRLLSHRLPDSCYSESHILLWSLLTYIQQLKDTKYVLRWFEAKLRRSLHNLVCPPEEVVQLLRRMVDYTEASPHLDTRFAHTFYQYYQET